MIRKPGKNSRTKRGWLWQQCSTLRTIKQIHSFMIINGFNSNPTALRELIFASAITVTGAMPYAHKLFHHISDPDLFMYNTMIRGSAQSTTPSHAISIYTQMQNHNIRPDNYTFPFLLKACSRLCSVLDGEMIHTHVLKLGFDSDTFVRNTIIHFYANCGKIEVARKIFDQSDKRDVVAWSALTVGYAKRGEIALARQLFDEMPVRDLVSWNVMITGYAKRGEMVYARQLFDEIPERDVVTWNAMIAGYVGCGSYSRALEVFEEMQCTGERPDDVTVLSLLSACAESGALDVGKRIHSSLLGGCSRDLSVVGNALIDMYAKCGSIESAICVFRGMRERDVSTWNSIIGGMAFNGSGEDSIALFMEMQREKVRPNEITFVGVLVACSHGRMVKEGEKYFELMRNEYGIVPNIKHYGCMVDLLGRAGLLEEAFEFVEKMEIEPNAIIWRTLLGACRIHNNVELGLRATEQLLRLRPDQSGDYVLLSNIYASVGEWDGAEKVRKLMEDRGVKKEPGCSLIEVDTDDLMQFLWDSNSKLDSRNVLM